MTGRYFEDFKAGDEIVTAGRTLTESAIIDFAAQYDPQSFHIDIDAATKSPYGGLISSGFQTLVIGFRLFLDTGVIAGTSIGSPGMDDLRWVQPVRPGDTLHSVATILETRASASKPDRGIIRMTLRTRNQKNEDVMTLTTTIFILKRP